MVFRDSSPFYDVQTPDDYKGDPSVDLCRAWKELQITTNMQKIVSLWHRPLISTMDVKERDEKGIS